MLREESSTLSLLVGRLAYSLPGVFIRHFSRIDRTNLCHRFEAEKHVTCCPQNAHKKLKPYAAAVAWMQAALLSGTIKVVPEAR
jgi:hypothetical protein